MIVPAAHHLLLIRDSGIRIIGHPRLAIAPSYTFSRWFPHPFLKDTNDGQDAGQRPLAIPPLGPPETNAKSSEGRPGLQGTSRFRCLERPPEQKCHVSTSYVTHFTSCLPVVQVIRFTIS